MHIDSDTHQQVASTVIAFCAGYVDKHYDAGRIPVINTDDLILAALVYFGLPKHHAMATWQAREGFAENPEV